MEKKILEAVLGILAVLLPTIVSGQNQMKTIVFVCEHGGARSTIASAYFNKIAAEKNLPYRSVFRGLTPDPNISKETANGLKSDGFYTDQFSPTRLGANDITPTTLFISLDCTVPSEFQTYQAWKGIPAISENYVAARKEIVKLLDALIEDLKNKNTLTKN